MLASTGRPEVARYNPYRHAAPIHDAAADWRQRCLLDDGSLLQVDLALWTPAVLDEVDRRFVKNLDLGEGSFFEKLEDQLTSGSPSCKKLMAELLWILMLFPSNIGAAKKRESLQLVWSWSGEQLPNDHPMLSDAVLAGLGSAGTAYNTHRWREIAFLVTAVREFKRRSETERGALLGDPWAFAEWLGSMPDGRNRQLSHILPHLLFPDHFERISSEGEKRAILAAFENVTERELRKWPTLKIDKTILNLRHRLEQERSKEIDFYDDEIQDQWRDRQRCWLLAWNPKHWPWSALNAHREKTRNGETVTERWRCAASAPREGEKVFLVRLGVEPRGVIAIGTVARRPYQSQHYDAERAEGGDTTQYIDVAFSDIRDASLDPFVSIDALEHDAPDQTWSTQSSGIEIKPKAARKLSALWDSLGPPRGEKQSAATVSLQATPDTGEPLNLIYYGPPGTGKTFRLQQHKVNYTGSDGERFEFVTFHQSYAYEDFVEGIRPIPTAGGQISYKIQHGVLRRVCQRAQKDPGRRYALFIDEINRGNIAKVFGELITLIEGDKRLRFDSSGRVTSGLELSLPYSGDRFGVPANIDVIATMNTADRSIALLDTALRRRFRFEELMPNPSIIDSHGSGIIPDDEGGEVDLRALLAAMNARLAHLLHRDQTIGHAYFTKVTSFADLRAVMAREVLPLLQEYFYDDWRHIRLVLADQAVGSEFQLVRRTDVKPANLFPSSEADQLTERPVFELVSEAAITPDAIRKIYEPV
jgi:5-methylcytosine-specific restriction protein B